MGNVHIVSMSYGSLVSVTHKLLRVCGSEVDPRVAVSTHSDSLLANVPS